MATILSQSTVCDGYDVRCRFADGRERVFHFATMPAGVQAAADQAEAALLAAEAAMADVAAIEEK